MYCFNFFMYICYKQILLTMDILSKAYTTSNKVDFYKKHLEVISCFMPIDVTPKEIEILANFMCLEGKDKIFPFLGRGRKKVQEKLGISSAGLGNHLASLKKKTLLILDEEETLIINPLITVESNAQGYQFKIMYNEDK